MHGLVEAGNYPQFYHKSYTLFPKKIYVCSMLTFASNTINIKVFTVAKEICFIVHNT